MVTHFIIQLFVEERAIKHIDLAENVLEHRFPPKLTRDRIDSKELDEVDLTEKPNKQPRFN